MGFLTLLLLSEAEMGSTFAVQVCVVAQNCLVEAYLCHVLKAERLIRALNLKQFMLASPLQRRNTVFVIDQCGLEMPLGECLRHLRPRSSDPRFLILDHEKSNDGIVHLLAMGAHGYVPHVEVSRVLVRAIFLVAANEFWVPPDAFREFLREVASVLRKDARGRQTTLREKEILELVRLRLSNREIAELLHIRVSTVKFHLSNILSKMQAKSRRDLRAVPSEQLSRMLAS
jgi:NarL family two-component system response regulator LiaR